MVTSILVIALEDSLSGSASSSDETDSDSDKVASLLDRSKRISRSPSPENESKLPQSPLAWFHSPPSTQIGVYKHLFSHDFPPASSIDELKALQQDVAGGHKWAMFMTAGGHFAGAIVRVSRGTEDDEEENISKRKLKRSKPDTEVLRHKTFHRYTSVS